MRIGGRVWEGFGRSSGQVSLESFQGPSSRNTEARETWPPLERLPIIYSCVKAIVDPLQSYPRRVLDYRGIPISPQPVWVESPNTLMSGNDLVCATAISLVLDGNAYLYPTYAPSGNLMSVAVANPLRVNPSVSGGRVVWYVDGKATNIEFVHLRQMTTPGRIKGIKKTRPLRLLSEISVEALRYIRQYLLRGVALQVLFSGSKRAIDTDIGREQIQQIMDDFHSGWRNAFNALTVPYGVNVEFIDSKLLSDMSGWTELRAVTDAEIAATFGLDPEEVNITQANTSRTYSNEPSRRARKYENAIKPVAHIIESGLSSLLPDGQKFDLDQKDSLYGGPHDRAGLVRNITLAEKDIGMPLLSIEEKRELLGFAGPVPAGATINSGGKQNV